MKALFDTQPIELTDRFVKAIQELMLAELELMRMVDADYLDCWEFGICQIGDLSRSSGLKFTYGGMDEYSSVEDLEKDMGLKRPYIFVQWDEV